MDVYTSRNILDLHGAELTTWRRALTQLIRDGGGNRMTFSNDFTATYNLEPFDDTPLATVRFTVTVGTWSLGDTDWLRHEVSTDFARVLLNDGRMFEISLNEGSEWRAHTTYVRDVPVDPGIMWGDVRAVQIEHRAAGSDINADNWNMDKIVITSVSTTGTVRDELIISGDPMWHFHKNDHQIWQHDFV